MKERKLLALGRTAALVPENGRIKLHVLVDRTSVEVFGNDGRLSMTSCFLPKDENKSFAAFSSGGTAKAIADSGLQVTDLAELTGIPVVTTLMARGAFPDSHPQNLGMPGMHGTFDDLYGTYDELTADLDESTRDKLFAGNAERVYGC